MRRPLQSLGEHVAKVKKGTGLTGERNTPKRRKQKAQKKLSDEKRRRAPSKKAKHETPAKKPKRATKAGRGKLTTGRKGSQAKSRLTVVPGRRVTVVAPVVRVSVKALDPLRKCGPNTTVQLLYLVHETTEGRRATHLVFFDRHGWYCEHGRTCPAVGHARKYNGQIARVS
jgi:hypothetical protein